VGGENALLGIFDALIARIDEDKIVSEKGRMQQLFTLHAKTVGQGSDGKRHHDGIVIYGPARNVKGVLNDTRIGTDAVIYPAWS
jgi:hypothetical protein